MASFQVIANRRKAINELSSEWVRLGCIELDKESLDEWLREICFKYEISMRLAREYIYISKEKAKAELKSKRLALNQEENIIMKSVVLNQESQEEPKQENHQKDENQSC